jgi:hypothetical protein
MIPEIFVVNDYITSWMASVGAIAALKRRAAEGGSYRVRISLVRLSSGSFRWACSTKATPMPPLVRRGHEYLAPDLFEAETPCGHYQGVTDQVHMSVTPGSYGTPLVPRGASKAEWLER